jgi:chromate transporter
VTNVRTAETGTFNDQTALAAYRLWDRFRNTPWQRVARRALAPLMIGFVIAGGYVMAHTGWQSLVITGAAAALMLRTGISPLWVLTAGGILGGLGAL